MIDALGVGDYQYEAEESVSIKCKRLSVFGLQAQFRVKILRSAIEIVATTTQSGSLTANASVAVGAISIISGVAGRPAHGRFLVAQANVWL